MSTLASNRAPSASPSAVTRLLLVRHGEVEARYQNTFGGRIDMNLSPRGQEQSKALAAWLCRKTVDALYASPMKRVQQTLAPMLQNDVPALTILPALREVDFGGWSGLSWEQVREKFGVHPYDWLHEIELGRIPGGESSVQFRTRVEPCMFAIVRQHPGGSIVIFTHGGVIRMMLAILLELSLPKTNSFEIEYASVTQVALRQELNEIELLNFTPWRDLIP